MTTTKLTQVEAQDGPVACTLTPDDYRDRTADLAALASRALRSRQPIDGGERLVFADGPDIERQLRTAIAAEASCCSFLAMILTRTAEGLTLDVTGPALARPVIAELFS
jgi:hypothetical protein